MREEREELIRGRERGCKRELERELRERESCRKERGRCARNEGV